MAACFSFHRTTSADIYTLPYTTLFRSLNFLAEQGRRYPGFDLHMETEATDLIVEGDRVVGLRAQNPSGPDRKSTRLNSSHVEISYAVFCLKKKKSTPRRRWTSRRRRRR